MNNQLSIFDFMDNNELPDFNTISEAETAKIIGDAIGVTFQYDKFFSDYRAKVGKCTLTCHYSHYNGVRDDRMFISVGWSNDADKSGCGSPTDSIEEAIKFFKRYMNRG